MKNLHLISTEKPSRLFNCFGKLEIGDYTTIRENLQVTNQHIYITSDEKLPYDDSIFNTGAFYHRDAAGDVHIITKDTHHPNPNFCSRIILTTDPYLIARGVQAVDDNFLEWFVNNPSCEDVEVIEDIKYFNVDELRERHVNRLPRLYSEKIGYKIIIPQEEPKQEIVGYRLKSHIDRMMVNSILKNAMPIWNDKDKSVYFIRGHVAGSLVAKMKELQVLDLWFTPIYESEEIKSDWVAQHHLDYYHKEGLMSNEPKQETLDEAAEHNYPIGDVWTEEQSLVRRLAFKKGAEWQAERMYSQEEVLKQLNHLIRTPSSKLDKYTDDGEMLTMKWFEQFKKK